MKTKLYFVSVSGGASSAAALIRATELYPKEMIKPVFANTNWEHPDMYRFVDDLENYVGIPFHRINNNGLTPADVSEDRQFIFNSLVASCTNELKVKPIQNWVKTFLSDDIRAFMLIGYNLGDRYNKARKNRPYGRLPNAVKNWNSLGVYVKYPLWFYPRITNPKQYIENLGLQLPELYKIRERNPNVNIQNNCYGGCFKQGIKYWRGLLIVFPEIFNERMEWENKMRKIPKLSNYAILQKTENGKKRAYPLEELKRDTFEMDDYELKRQQMIDDFESDCTGDECQIF